MIFIDSSDKVEKFNEDIQNELKYSNSFITVDTEFIRENNPLPILCLIQISTSSCVYLIDPLKVPISFLQFCLSNKSLKKVFHSSEQDIEILVNNGLTINNIYDTQLYEMLLNTKENVSYHDIVYRYLGKSLRKSYVLSNWLNRPLSYKQITYAMNDVVYLRQVFIKQQKKLRDLNRENWLDDEIIDMYNSLSKIEKLQNSIDKDNIPIMLSLTLVLIGNIVDIRFLFQGLENFKIITYIQVLTYIAYIASIFLFVKTENDVLLYTILKSSTDLVVNLFLFMFAFICFLKKFL